jgi:uncharacterized protein involved in outer membrane biogenesis
VRKVVYAVLGLMVLLAAAAIVLPLVIDLNAYKSQVSAHIKAMTGRDLVIAGNIELSLLPAPMLAVNDVRLANVAGAAVPHIVRLESAEARIALWPLLRGKVRINSLKFVEPVVELEILADGRTNWQFPLAAEGGAAAAALAAEEDSGFEVRLDRLVVENATIVYRDGTDGRIELIEDVNVVVAAESLAGPFHARGRLVARGAELAFKLEVGALESGPIAVAVELDLVSAEASLSIAGTLSSPSADAEFTGALKAEGASLAGIVAAFDPVAGRQPLLERKFSLTGAMSGSAARAAINDIEIEFGGVQAKGVLHATFRGVPQIEIALAVGRVDLDQLRSESAPASRPPEQAPAATAEAAPFALPAGVNVTLDLRLGVLVLNRSMIRQVQIVTTLDQGLLTLQQGSALLPGGSSVTAFGVLDSVDGMPRFTGQVEGSGDNLRAVLDWLSVPVPPVHPDRLRKFTFSTNIELTPELARLAALDLRLDRSHLNGGVTVEFRERPTFTAIVALDRFDLDAYLQPRGAGEQAAAKAAAPWGGLIGALAAVDGELKAHIDKLVYKAVPISGLVIDAALKDGKLKLRRLAADDVAGASGTFKGLVEPAVPTFNLTYDLETADLVRLLRVFEVATPAPLKHLGRLSARGRLEGDLSTIAFETTVYMTEARAKLAGTLSGIAARPVVDATVDLRGEDLKQLVRRFGADDLPGAARAAGPYSLRGWVKGHAEEVEVALDLRALGARAKVTGAFTGITEGLGYDVTVTASHPDLAALVETFYDGVDLAQRSPGEVRMRARVVGDAAQARISVLTGRIGPTRVDGVVRARWDTPKPSLDVDLTAGEIVFDMFLPAAASAQSSADGNGAGSPQAPGHWSREPIDLSGLRAFDAKVHITANALKFRKHRFEAVTLRLSLADGVIEVDELAGRLYGAPVMFSARLTDAKPPSAEITFRLEGVDLRALLVDEAGVEAISGRLNLSGKLRTQGRSEFELVSALTGEVAIDARDGAIRGIDLGLLNQRLGTLASEADFVRLVETALTRGETRIHALQGSFTAANGVLRSNDLRVVLDGAQGRAEATVDLPLWQLAFDSTFSLADHPNAPLVGIALRGPIDNPRREIRERELRGYVVRKLLGSAIGTATPKTGEESGAVGAAPDAHSDAAAPPPAPREAKANRAEPAQLSAPKPQRTFDSVLQGITKKPDE